MKLCLLTLVLVGASVAARAEDCPLILNQRFQLHYNQWQSSQAPTMATTQAVYEVDAGIPVFTYRLGALALNGAVEYNRLAYGGSSDSDSGLSRYGARLSLFPYRPFRLYLDYQHSQSPDLFDSGRVKGDTWGAGATYHSRILQDVRLSYRHGESKLGDEREDWSQWKLEANQQMGGTQVTFQSLRQDYETRIPGQGWRYFQANLDTESHSAADWTLRTRSQFQDSISSSWFDIGATFYGPISGDWHSLTNASAGASTTGDTRTDHTFASESLVYAVGRWNAYGTGALSRSLTDAAGQDTRMDSGTLGGTYTLTRDWRIHGDLGVSSFEQGMPGLVLRRTTTTMNLGIARGGDVPELIRHTLFFLSDWTFTRRTREEYPPDYVPSELAQELFQRRMRQTGNFGFTADVWRISDNASQGRVDWARVTGQVQTRGRLTLYVAGDYKDDRGLSLPGVDARNTDLMMNGSYQLALTSITASAGYSSNSQRLTPGAAAPMATWAGAQDESSRHYSLGVTTRLGKVPVGALVQRFDAALTPAATTLYTWADLSFRQVSLRVRYETTRMDNGIRSSRITVDLLRWFDTICTRSWR
ncbi:hypothetical protein [Geothrix alkalitolerans]|uniref:hypothetical protein n=1 Tax=Geothrix alkalitolerans TaxID=2922724 RepID=UPI001FAFF3EF|nr:hypothetical protein [Geothrix alkalitolerans]